MILREIIRHILKATYHLGRLYLKGLGVSQDTKKGLKFIREAANGNS